MNGASEGARGAPGPGGIPVEILPSAEGGYKVHGRDTLHPHLQATNFHGFRAPIMRRLRHPLVALFAAFLLALSATSDAAGLRACAHHTHGDHGAHGASHGAPAAADDCDHVAGPSGEVAAEGQGAHGGHAHAALPSPGHGHGAHGNAGHGPSGDGHAGHADHAGHAHPVGHAPSTGDSEPAGDAAAEEHAPDAGCDCGFLCVAMSGPPPVEPVPALSVPGLEAPASPRIERTRTEDPLYQPSAIPHYLPFSQAPPLPF